MEQKRGGIVYRRLIILDDKNSINKKQSGHQGVVVAPLNKYVYASSSSLSWLEVRTRLPVRTWRTW